MFNLHSSQASIRIRQSSPAVAEGTNDHSVPVSPNSVSRVAVLFLHRFICSVNGHKLQKLNSQFERKYSSYMHCGYNGNYSSYEALMWAKRKCGQKEKRKFYEFADMFLAG